MTTTSYAEFLATKKRELPVQGIKVDASQVNEKLFPFQRDIVIWAIERGRGAIFADTGLGKTLMEIESARLLGGTALIIAPLSVCPQTIREGEGIGVPITYTADGSTPSPGIYITNYERAHRIVASKLQTVILDESSILKNVDGKTRQLLTDHFADVPYRLAFTATPAPNDIAEMTNHAVWLGVATRANMLASYFIHDDEGWRLKGHAANAMWQWMSSWAVAVRTPADLGYPDDGYVLPDFEKAVPLRHSRPLIQRVRRACR